ncbi:MAG: HD domain-containing protein [Lachnospiraceae bacterium]|nr:HD domain-containing protein [Lachnospiraceae bacterium]
MLEVRQELLQLFDIERAFKEDIDDALNHGRLVSNLAYRLAKELSYPEDFCMKMAEAGMLHDIGKLQLGEYLYGRRTNALRIEEIKYVRMHPTLGYKFLTDKNIGDEDFRLFILHHHENYDGSGYPDNIKGDDIPNGSKILRVCDVYAALTSERPYRAAFDKNTTMELMIDEVKNFDMKVFLAFMRVVHDDDFSEIEEYIESVNKKVIDSRVISS